MDAIVFFAALELLAISLPFAVLAYASTFAFLAIVLSPSVSADTFATAFFANSLAFQVRAYPITATLGAIVFATSVIADGGSAALLAYILELVVFATRGSLLGFLVDCCLDLPVATFFLRTGSLHGFLVVFPLGSLFLLGSILGLLVDGFLQPARRKMRDTDGGFLKLISEYSVFSDSSSALNLVFHLKENGLEKRNGF